MLASEFWLQGTFGYLNNEFNILGGVFPRNHGPLAVLNLVYAHLLSMQSMLKSGPVHPVAGINSCNVASHTLPLNRNRHFLDSRPHTRHVPCRSKHSAMPSVEHPATSSTGESSSDRSGTTNGALGKKHYPLFVQFMRQASSYIEGHRYTYD